MPGMKRRSQPDREQLVQLAKKRPDIINALVAYFVWEWQEIKLDAGDIHGRDQMGVVCHIPNYAGDWGVNQCLFELYCSPHSRSSEGPAGITVWLNQL